MAKFKVKVRVTAECVYEVEVDTSDESKAENTASSMWREKLPEDFQVEKGYICNVETEAEQLTADCPECGIEHRIPLDAKPVHVIVDGKLVPDTNVEWWPEDHQYCAACGAKMEAEDKANG